MTKTYLCTAIPYVNGHPHIGHAMDYLLADVFARYRRLCGDQVRLSAGTDEHGNKVFSSALKAGLSVEAYAKENSDKFRNFIDELDITYTDFTRTTSPEHAQRCAAIWTKLKPHIYSAEYDGWYCEGCESFVTAKEYEENHGVCPDHNKPYQKVSEKNYYLRISDFREQIRAAIESGEMEILPEFRKQEMLRLLADAPDISISRPRGVLSWGVPVPDDPDQVMYVWVDALSNYITALGYPDFTSDSSIFATGADPASIAADFAEFWPATAQFVGKDILRFHAITWPAILLGLGLPLPRRIVSHGHVLANGQKMSKSLGNVVDPMEVLHRHGLAAFRYFFLSHIDTFADSDFSWEKFDTAYANELANDLGNLVQRLATLCAKNQIVGQPAAAVLGTGAPAAADPATAGQPAAAGQSAAAGKSAAGQSAAASKSAAGQPITFPPAYAKFMDNFEFNKAFDLAWHEIQSLNKKIDDEKPWALAKSGESARLAAVMNELVAGILHAAALLAPFLPETSARIAEIFGTDSVITPPATPLFPKN